MDALKLFLAFARKRKLLTTQKVCKKTQRLRGNATSHNPVSRIVAITGHWNKHTVLLFKEISPLKRTGTLNLSVVCESSYYHDNYMALAHDFHVTKPRFLLYLSLFSSTTLKLLEMALKGYNTCYFKGFDIPCPSASENSSDDQDLTTPRVRHHRRLTTSTQKYWHRTNTEMRQSKMNEIIFIYHYIYSRHGW